MMSQSVRKFHVRNPPSTRLALLAATVIVAVAPPSAQGQVFVGGPAFASSGLSVGVVGPYGFGSPWAGSYGASFYSTGYGGGFYNPPFVGYTPGGYGFGYSPYGYYVRGFALPPVVIPAETMYGPGAVQQFLGVGQQVGYAGSNGYAPTFNLPNGNNQNGGVDGGFGVLAPGVRVPKANIAASNGPARERAKKQLAIGDDWFRKQEYGNAASAYREAIRAAPDVADAYFHQAAIAVAQQRYEAAVESIKTGLRVSTTYVDGEFRYPTLYGDNKLSRIAHLEALAQAATNEPSSDLYFLMGVMLFFDEQPRRSSPFFTKAQELVAGESWHIGVFREILRRMDADAAENAVRRGGAVNAQPIDAGPAPAAKPPVRVDVDGKEI